MEDKTLFIIMLLILVILMSGCTQKQEIIKVGTPVMVEINNNIETNIIENETEIVEIGNISKLELRVCSHDSDCIKIQGGCCPCTSGGGDIAINKKYEEYWNNKLAKECVGTRNICLAVMGACGENIRCINNNCEFTLN